MYRKFLYFMIITLSLVTCHTDHAMFLYKRTSDNVFPPCAVTKKENSATCKQEPISNTIPSVTPAQILAITNYYCAKYQYDNTPEITRLATRYYLKTTEPQYDSKDEDIIEEKNDDNTYVNMKKTQETKPYLKQENVVAVAHPKAIEDVNLTKIHIQTQTIEMISTHETLQANAACCCIIS